MDIFGVLTLIGGLAMFLFGMNVMGDGLAKLSGGRMEQILEKLTQKRIMAVLLGAAVTAVIQSSSATTVMVVGFVNSGIMQLSQAAGIIMGANIGTTVTSWLLSLTGIESANVWVQLLKPSSFAPVLAAIGIIFTMTEKENTKKREIGSILLGFAVLMFGMETMSGAVAPLADDEGFTGILTAFSNPILGMLAGTILTAIIQSSSASVGILQALCVTGAVSYATALPIIMGQNIGTCVTAIISSIGASKNAKRASMVHLFFNLIGTILFMVVFYTLNSFVHFAFLGESAKAAGIAVIHSLFNIGCTIVLFPFAKQLEKLATLAIPEHIGNHTEEKRESAPILDERFLEQPGFAIELCKNAAIDMGYKAKDAISLALTCIQDYSREKRDRVIALEQEIDHYEDVLGSYLVKLSSKDLSQKDSRTLSVLLHCISDYERISDHAINITDSIDEMRERDLKFSDRAEEELGVYMHAVNDIVDRTVDVFKRWDLDDARHIEPLEQVIDELNLQLRQRHIKRLRKGKCTIELGLILEDIIRNMERVADHCSNVAVCMIEVSVDEFDTHEYLEELTTEENYAFHQEVGVLREKYLLPEKIKKEKSR
ncbi:MAG: Na/Pi cotransporter family protein [Agathobacter sp.]|nr:Na/Pi cotransporter family protein [Agathobacter sp.]